MKNLFKHILFGAACMFLACTNSSRTVNSKDLAGRYKVDIAEELSEKFYESSKNEIEESFLKLLSLGIEIDIVFYDNNKGVIEFGGWTFNLLGEESETMSFEYKIKQDSILQITDANGDSLQCVIRKIADNYDYLQIVDEENSKKVLFNLTKKQ